MRFEYSRRRDLSAEALRTAIPSTRASISATNAAMFTTCSIQGNGDEGAAPSSPSVREHGNFDRHGCGRSKFHRLARRLVLLEELRALIRAFGQVSGCEHG